MTSVEGTFHLFYKFSKLLRILKPGTERIQALGDILRSGYVIATKPVHYCKSAQ